MPTKWLQERAKGSKNGHGMPPHRVFCGSLFTTFQLSWQNPKPVLAGGFPVSSSPSAALPAHLRLKPGTIHRPLRPLFVVFAVRARWSAILPFFQMKTRNRFHLVCVSCKLALAAGRYSPQCEPLVGPNNHAHYRTCRPSPSFLLQFRCNLSNSEKNLSTFSFLPPSISLRLVRFGKGTQRNGEA